ncbi:UNVERIFIED_CONTAM: hypothetical protein HDU68_003702, partial [Siphonaria sp. JEL0065]
MRATSEENGHSSSGSMRRLKLPGLNKKKQASGLSIEAYAVENAFFTTEGFRPPQQVEPMRIEAPPLPVEETPPAHPSDDILLNDPPPIQRKSTLVEQVLNRFIPPKPKKKKKPIAVPKDTTSKSSKSATDLLSQEPIPDDPKPEAAVAEMSQSQPDLLTDNSQESTVKYIEKEEFEELKKEEDPLPELFELPPTIIPPKAVQEAALRRHRDFVKKIRVVPVNEVPVIEQVTYEQLLDLFTAECQYLEKRETNMQLNLLNQKSRRLSVFANIRVEAINWDQLNDMVYNFFRLHKLRQEHVIGMDLTRGILRLF